MRCPLKHMVKCSEVCVNLEHKENQRCVWKFCPPPFLSWLLHFVNCLLVPLTLLVNVRWKKANFINVFPCGSRHGFICYCTFVISAQSPSSSKSICTHSCMILSHLSVFMMDVYYMDYFFFSFPHLSFCDLSCCCKIC